MKLQKELRETKKWLLQLPQYSGKKIHIYQGKLYVERKPVPEADLITLNTSEYGRSQKVLKTHTLSIGYWNINGLTMDKFTELIDDIKQYDINCLSETWFSETNV